MPQQPDFNPLPGLLLCGGLPLAGAVLGWWLRGRFVSLGWWGVLPFGGQFKKWYEELK